jgi:hypothetical protein
MEDYRMSSRLIITEGVFYEGILRDDVPKSKDKLRPIFEAFTNAHESIKDLRKRIGESVSGKIRVELYFQQGTTVDDFIFEKLIVADNTNCRWKA